MKICILGLGVIGTTYGYVFQKAGHQVEHWIREEKRASTPKQLSIHLLDGRYDHKGVEATDIYPVHLAQPDTDYDFIFISVGSGDIGSAIQYCNHINGSLVLFCNFWYKRGYYEWDIGHNPYTVGFPTAGGRMENGTLDCVLFDHVMLEDKQKTDIPNYDSLISLFHSAGLKVEIPYDMVKWIWLHMAINAGVTSTAARDGQITDPHQLAIDLMGDSHALAEAVRTIRETIQVVHSRGVDMKKYLNEIFPYMLPAPLAGIIMKKMFAKNELTRRIMTLHHDIDDILYGCDCVYQTAKESKLKLPRYYEKMDRIYQGLKKQRS